MDGRTRARLEAQKAFDKRAAQLKANADRALAALKVANIKDADVKRRKIKEAQGNVSRANKALTTAAAIKAQGNVDPRTIQNEMAKANITEQQAKQKRNSNSHVRQPDNNPESFGWDSKKQPHNNTGDGSTTNPYKAKQPDQNLVSPILKQNMQSNKARQGPTQPTETKYTLSLNDSIGKDKTSQEVITPYGNLDFIYGEKQLSSTGKVIQPAINFLDEYTRQRPKNIVDSFVMPITQPIAGGLKQGAALVGSLDNLGHMINAWRTGKEQKEKNIELKNTIDQPALTALLEGQSTDQLFQNYKEYLSTYNPDSIKGELGTFAIGAKGSDKLLKLFPIRAEKFNQPGIKLIQSQTVSKGKTPIGTPAVLTKEVTAKSYSLGYGSKTTPIISKVGNKITLGKPNLDNISVEVKAVTKKQLQRGIKMAADSSKYEQSISAKLIPKVFGLTDESKELAKTEEELIDILTSTKKDTIINKELGSGVFENVSKTEQPSFTKAISKAQKQLVNPIGKYEGSLSGYYFTSKQYLRTLGDVDLHADTFQKASQQMKRITPEIKADPGRKYVSVIDKKHKSTKIFSQSDNTDGRILYHGTSPLSAKQILKEGFDANKSNTSDKTIFTATHPRGAYFGDEGALYFKEMGIKPSGNVGLKVTMKKGIKEFDASKHYDLLDEDPTGDALRKLARKEHSHTLHNLDQAGGLSAGTEVEILSGSAIKSIEGFKGVKGKITNPDLLKPKTKTGKVLEILNPEETDEFGVLQSIEGDTLFAKSIPKDVYKVKEGKTYGRQRQILKKMESLYSLQKDESTGLVRLRPFEKRYKDVADTYALGKSALETEFTKGTKEYDRLDLLLNNLKGHFKKHDNFDIDKYLSKKGISQDRTVLKSDSSIIEKIGSTTGKSLIESSKQITKPTPLTKTNIQPERKETSMIYGDRKPASINISNTIRTRPIERSLTRSPTMKIKTPSPTRPSSPTRYSPKSVTRSLTMKNSPRYSITSSPTKSPPSILKSPGSILSPPAKSLTSPPRPNERSPPNRPSMTIRNPSYLSYRQRPIPAIIPIRTKDRTDRTKGTRKVSHNFFANTHAAQITGFRTKKSDIDVGDKKTEKLYRDNISLTKKKYKVSDKKNGLSLTGKSKRSLL